MTRRFENMKETGALLLAVCLFVILSRGVPGSQAGIVSPQSGSIEDYGDKEILPHPRPARDDPDRQFTVASIDVLDKRNVWIVVREEGTDRLNRLRRSVVLHTSDGGRSWERQFLTKWEKELAFPSQYLRDVYFVTPRLGWIAGGSGLIFRTTDGGKSWAKQREVAEDSLDKIHFIDTNTGWVMGHESAEDAVVLHTKDGGLNWRLSRMEVKGWLNSIWFADGNNGWIVGENGQAYQSSDAGTSWRSRAHELTSKVEDWRQTDVDFPTVKFLDRKLGFITAQIRQDLAVRFDPRGIIFRTRDGGRTWQSLTATNELGIRYAEFLNDREAWLVPRDLRKKLILHTEDGGKSWRNMPTPVAKILSVHFADSRNGWLVANASDYPDIDQIFCTNDGGNTWIESTLPRE